MSVELQRQPSDPWQPALLVNEFPVGALCVHSDGKGAWSNLRTQEWVTTSVMEREKKGQKRKCKEGNGCRSLEPVPSMIEGRHLNMQVVQAGVATYRGDRASLADTLSIRRDAT